MPLETFKTSEPLTLGVELELQLVSRTDLDLVHASPDLLELLDKRGFPGNVVPEITESMIEISTGIHHDADTLLTQLRAMRDALVSAGERLNVGVCGGGTHPFQNWSERRIFPKPRFKEVSQLYGYLAKQFTIFGQHIHIGCESGDQAMYLLHALNRYVPHFIALAASSPFVQRGDTLFHSSRLNSVFAFPLSGRAPFTMRWDDFAQGYFQRMERTGIVKSMKDFYWDIRPKPEYGTIELRVCDTPLTVERAAALADYLRALCRMLLDTPRQAPAEDDYLVYNYNRFQACRFGLDGSLVDPKTYDTCTLRQDILATLSELARGQDDPGGPHLAHIQRIAQFENDASFLRRQYQERGSSEGMVEAAVQAFQAGPVD